MHARYFAKLVLSLVALWTVGTVALAAEPVRRIGPVSPASLQKMRPPPGTKQPAIGPDMVAEIGAFACANPNSGTPIPVVADPRLQNIAVAKRLPTGALMIYFNVEYMRLFRAPTVLFWLQHECMHHQLGHTLQVHAIPLSPAQRAGEENAADCAAIKTMVKRQPPMIDAEGLRAIESDVGKLTGGGIYKTGPQRVRWIDGCVVDAVADIKARQAN